MNAISSEKGKSESYKNRVYKVSAGRNYYTLASKSRPMPENPRFDPDIEQMASHKLEFCLTGASQLSFQVNPGAQYDNKQAAEPFLYKG